MWSGAMKNGQPVVAGLAIGFGVGSIIGAAQPRTADDVSRPIVRKQRGQVPLQYVQSCSDLVHGALRYRSVGVHPPT